jgi:hypothetical protein
MNAKPLVERAFELALEGKEPPTIREKLKEEGYPIAEITGHLAGPTLTAELRKLARRAAAAAPKVTEQDA